VQTRERGYAIEDGDVTAEYASVGASSTDRHDYPVAAIGLTFRRDAIGDAWEALGSATARSAAALTARLAGRPERP
jgi:DNA-binding IclR family transcriptional regulator